MPERMEEQNDLSLPPLDASESPQDAPETDPPAAPVGRQRAAAAVPTMHPPNFLARFSAQITQKTSAIINNARSLYVVPDGDQAPGVVSDGYRVGLKRKVAAISRTQYEVYSFSTKHNLSEAAVDELLEMLSNVCTSSGPAAMYLF